MRSKKNRSMMGRAAAVLAGLMTLAAGWVDSSSAAPAAVAEEASGATLTDVMVLDADTARILVDMGLLELDDADRSGLSVGFLQSGGTGISVLVVLPLDDASVSGQPAGSDPTQWSRSGKMPPWRRDFPNGGCKDGVLKVRWYREHTVTRTCPDGSKITTIVVEEVVRDYACTDQIPALPPGYSERDAWLRGMPSPVPGEAGGSTKRFKGVEPSCP